MDIGRTVIILLLLSIVNIGGVLILLFRSSNWNHHQSISVSFKQVHVQHLERLHNEGDEYVYLEVTTPASHTSKNTSVARLRIPPSQRTVERRGEIKKYKLTPRLPLRRMNTSKSQRAGDTPYIYGHKLKREAAKSQADAAVTVRKDGRSYTFNISKDFTFPHQKCILRDTAVIAETPWVKDLAMAVAKRYVKTIFALTASDAYKESLFNWLISAVLGARLSLEQMLVIAMDRKTHDLLQEHGIVSVHVPPTSVFGKTSRISAYGLVMFTRISVVRLLNHWGFSVVIIDTDAIVLRDPQPLFDEHPSSSIVASKGFQPKKLYDVWNATMCNGLLLIRSSGHTGTTGLHVTTL